jgi:hypothetical protein
LLLSLVIRTNNLPPLLILPSLKPPGFRDKAELLESTFMRMGVLAALRSMARGGQVIGNMGQKRWGRSGRKGVWRGGAR